MRQDRPIEIVPENVALVPFTGTFAAAFQDDPALRCIEPDAAKRRTMLPGFFKVMAEQARRHGEILASPDGGAASLWHAPGKARDGFFAPAYDNLRMLAGFRLVLPRGLTVAEEMYKRHPSP
ncbi:hypothetical protein [uncultured Erythrobacter sp.]|uniref:hypothetical protein n=1 Tax=uncultured Erythrobacter sp. TaxID=263913 RepID=UPI00262756A6|nr:hypothetical protein [uncultured Erythrobacter sp.]